jgi:hypothetical protein
MKWAYQRNSKRFNYLILIIVLIIAVIILFPFLENSLFWIQPTATENALINLGNPFAEDGHTGRALNVWDLQVFDNKVYVAGGSTVDNSGPVNIWAYNPTEEKFQKEDTIQEEAIEHFRVFDHQLYIPAADPLQGDAHKFYRRDSNRQWQLFQSSAVELAHVRDLIKLETGEILLVGNNREFKQLSKPATAITVDGGRSFRGAGLENPPDSEFNWFFSVFTYQGKIYAPTSLLKDSSNLSSTIAVFNPEQGKFELDPKLGNNEFIPQTHLEQRRGKQGFYIIYRPWHPVEFQEALIYPVRSYSYYDQNYHKAYMNSIGFYIKPGPGISPFKVAFPDELIINEKLYAVANEKIAADKFKVYLYKTDNPTNKNSWEEVLHFRSRNRVRSFEYLDGKLYFGLGQNYDEPIGRSGEIMSLPFRPSVQNNINVQI